MKILLLNLPKNPDNIYDYEQVIQPIGLAYISSFLKFRGKNVVLKDAQPERMKRIEIIRFVASQKPDLLGLSAMTYNVPIVASLIPQLKAYLPDLKVVLGGPHASAEPLKTLEQIPDLDFIVQGEGESTLDELCDAIMGNHTYRGVKGIGFRENGHLIINQRRDPIPDLDKLPFPDWGAFPMEKYWDGYTTRNNYARIFGSRGCPFHCSFCGVQTIFGKGIRYRSPENIVQEVEYLYDAHNVRELLIGDSTFNTDRNWVREICEGILDTKKKIIWRASIRAGLVDKETASLMKKAGCQAVVLGVESADEEMLRSMNKGQRISEIQKGIDILNEVGLESHHHYIIGLPGDTVESIEKSIEFAKKNSLASASFFFATPLPGTRFFDRAKEEGLKIDDWTRLHNYTISYVPQGMTKDELNACYRKAVKTFYLRPSYLFRRLSHIHSLVSLKIHMRYFFRILLRVHHTLSGQP